CGKESMMFPLPGFTAHNPFIDVHVPVELWPRLLQVFGGEVDYWPGRDELQAVTIEVIWKEGAEDEDISPGRYSNIWIRNSDLAEGPKAGDAVSHNGQVFDVVRVQATSYGFSRAILQENEDG